MTEKPIKITALTAEKLAKLLSTSAGKRITSDDVRLIANKAGILQHDGTISLIDYTAYLANEVTKSSKGVEVNNGIN